MATPGLFSLQEPFDPFGLKYAASLAVAPDSREEKHEAQGHFFALLIWIVFAALPDGAAATTQLPTAVRPTHYDVAIEPDAKALTFSAQVSIRIDVLQPTANITLNALDLSITAARLSGVATGKVFATPGIKIDASNQTATFDFGQAVPVGSYQLALEYTGKIGTQPVGLFAIDYETAAGRARALYTQFEAADARRFVPSWDEPAYKATFSLQATASRPGKWRSATCHLRASSMRVVAGAGSSSRQRRRCPPTCCSSQSGTSSA